MYEVVWMPRALGELAMLWMIVAYRNAITAASHEVDSVLEMFPHSAGTIRFDTVHEFACPPLGVEFEVDDAGRKVFVLSVWDTNRGRPPLTGN
jgi:hypothetical protein